MIHGLRLLALLALGLAACESPESQTYDPILDEEIGDPDHPLVPDKPDDPEERAVVRVRYVCADGETFFFSRSPDRRTVVLALDGQDLTLSADGGTTYRDASGATVAQVEGDLVSVDLDGETTLRDCRPQAE